MDPQPLCNMVLTQSNLWVIQVFILTKSLSLFCLGGGKEERNKGSEGGRQPFLTCIYHNYLGTQYSHVGT